MRSGTFAGMTTPPQQPVRPPSSAKELLPPGGPVTQWWNPRSLRFLLPIGLGDRVLVVGAFPVLVRSLDLAGVRPCSALTKAEARKHGDLEGETVILREGRLPLPDGAFDHVMVPSLRAPHLPLLDRELVRALRPGGGLFVGAPYRLRTRAATGIGVRQGRRLLARSGFTDIEVYGILSTLANPRHLVPLDAPEALRWFLRAAYLPTSTKGVVVAPLFAAAAPLRLPPVLFRALGFVATRPAVAGAAP